MKRNIKTYKTTKICICGAFAFGTNDNGGQPVKTRELYYALCEKYRKENIDFVETKDWKRHPFRLFFSFLFKARHSKTLIMLPAHNGIQVFSRLLIYAKKHFKCNIFYNVIGGWLPEKVKGDSKLKTLLIKFDGIWVETASMKESLNEQGLNNVAVVPNFKNLTILTPNELVYNKEKPYRLCTFARIMKEKGVEDAIDAVKIVNAKYGDIVFTLDLYGQVDNGYKEQFDVLCSQFPDFILYKGIVHPNKSVEILKSYFALLFPTHYYTEGIPGTLIDAYAAGVPVVTALWKNSRDIFEDGKTGWGFEFDDYEEFVKLLERVYENPDAFIKMKSCCLEWADKYRSGTVIKQIDELLK